MAEIIYREVVQVVILFGSESWILSAAMEITAEGTHTVFLQQITGKQMWQRMDGMWVTLEAEEVWEAAGV